jgi:RNA-splicing ligase RtcB
MATSAADRLIGSPFGVTVSQVLVCDNGPSSVLTSHQEIVFESADEVVQACGLAGLAAPVVRLQPKGVVRG